MFKLWCKWFGCRPATVLYDGAAFYVFGCARCRCSWRVSTWDDGE